MTMIKRSRIFLRALSIAICLQMWASGQMGSTQVDAVEGTWTEYYQAPYSNLVRGGQEGKSRWPTFICQATFAPGARSGKSSSESLQGTYPGKFVPRRSSCFISRGKSVVRMRTFKVLKQSQGRSYVWVQGNGQRINESAVVGGRTDAGKKLYICRTKPIRVRKFRATLVGRIEEGSEECIASLRRKSSAYRQYDILTDATPLSVRAKATCEPREEFEVITSVRNEGNSDQTITKSFQMGMERKEGSSQTNSKSETKTNLFGFSLEAEAFGVKAGFETKVGKSSTTGFDWTKTSSDVWNSATTQTLPINVKARTQGTLQQLVGICGNVKVRTGFIKIDSKPL